MENFLPLLTNSLDQGYQSLVVGDVKQAIYRWRGGDLSLLQQEVEQHIGISRVDVKELNSNYRSSKHIVEFNNQVFESAALKVAADTGVAMPQQAYGDVAQHVSKADDGFVEVSFIEEEIVDGAPVIPWKEESLDRLAMYVDKLQLAGVPLKDIAILVRKNEDGQQIVNYLLAHKNSAKANPQCRYDVVSNESLRLDGAASVNLLLGALQYLHNPDDAIARAQLGYEFAKLHEPDRVLTEVFTVTEQTFFEHRLPAAFAKEKMSLKKLPLYELTETLIEIFRLGEQTGELSYLQAFQDVVLEFYSRERNDLGAFLEWWQLNKRKKSIQVSGEVDAIQILTIHKSKGLQFRYVIVPFCSWSMDHEAWQAPNLWVASETLPFNDAGFVPVKYGNVLEKSVFRQYYEEERTRTFPRQPQTSCTWHLPAPKKD
ncbi:MAG: UvrD-helicase domain-containing protein [Bacteroidia bacterium]|nr:UvrD-helicase domain-containing protein [Bacteroidia bacterium]